MVIVEAVHQHLIALEEDRLHGHFHPLGVAEAVDVVLLGKISIILEQKYIYNRDSK